MTEREHNVAPTKFYEGVGGRILGPTGMEVLQINQELVLSEAAVLMELLLDTLNSRWDETVKQDSCRRGSDRV